MYSSDLGIFFREGIANMLLAIDEANLDMVNRFDDPEVRIYREGFAAAIGAVALAFGIRPQNINLPATKAIREQAQLSAPDKSM